MVSEHVINPQIVSVNPDVIAQDYVGNVIITGSETSWSDGVETVSFVMHDNSAVAFQPVSFTVNTDTEIDAEMPSLLNQQVGVYDVYVDDLVLENGLTLTVVNAIAGNENNKEIVLYPNPAADFITVKNYKNAGLKIFDISGKLLMEIANTTGSQKIDLKNLDKGIYFMILTKNGNKPVKKLFVKK